MNNRLRRSVRATVIGLALNVVLAAVKLAAGIVGHSQALIADAVESLADVFSSLVVWRGVVVASTPPDEDHPYGHGKAEPIAGAMVATMLLLAAAWIAIDSIHEMITPHVAPAPFTLAVLIGVLLIKESLFRFAKREAEALSSIAVRTDAWHHRSDAITSLAAGIGIAVALIGGKGYEMADDIAAVVAAGIIARNGWSLLRPALDELMDMRPDLVFNQRIRDIAAAIPDVAGVEKCIVRKMGFHFFVDLHIEVVPSMTVEKAHEVAHRVKDQVRQEMPEVHDVLVHVEPVK